MTRLLFLASALALVSVPALAQAPAAGSIAVQVKNVGDGSTTVWLGPGSPPVLQGIAAGGSPSLFGLGSAISVNEGTLIVSPAWSSITGTPTTLSGYGITDALSAATAASTYVSLTGSYADPAWITALAWSKITGTPTTLAGYGITDALSAATAASIYVSLTGSYADPAWITALAWSKITGAPAFLTGNQTITFSGDFTGAGTTSVFASLVDTTVAAGSYAAANITVDAKGRILSASNGLPEEPLFGDYYALRLTRGGGYSWATLEGMDPNDIVTYRTVSSSTRTGLVLPAYDEESPGVTELRSADHQGLVQINLGLVSGTLLTTTGNGSGLTGLDPYALQQRSATNGQVLTWSSANSRWQPASVGGSGTVTSVGLTGGNGITVTGTSPITTSGTWTLGVDASALKSHLSLGNVENTALSTWVGSSNLTTLGTITTGTWQGTNIDWSRVSKTGSSLADLATRSAGDLNSGTLPAARLPAPTTTTLGGVQRNTGTGTQFVNGIDSAGALTYGTPAGAAVEIGLACSDETSDLTTGTAKVTFRMPHAMTLTAVRASVTTASTGSTIIVNIKEGGTTVLGTKLSIDASERTSTTAASAATITDSALADDSEITIDIDQVGSSTPGKGLKIWIIGTRN